MGLFSLAHLSVVAREVWTADLMTEGFTPGTVFGWGDDAIKGAIVAYLASPAWDKHSFLYLRDSDFELSAGPQGAAEVMDRRLLGLRQLHHFACAHARGGFC